MGLISRVSSRTYRQIESLRKFSTKMDDASKFLAPKPANKTVNYSNENLQSSSKFSSFQNSTANNQQNPAPSTSTTKPREIIMHQTPAHQPPEMPQLQNIVATVNLGITLDLKKIAMQARNAEYNPKRFAAVIMRIRDPRTTALIFSSGKMGWHAKFKDFKIQNMVGSVDVKFPIRLEKLMLS